MRREAKRRIQVSVDPTVFRVLSLPPDDAGSPAVTGALSRYARLVAIANRDLESIFSRAEWNALASLLNGNLSLTEDPGDCSRLALVRAELVAAVRLGILPPGWSGARRRDREAGEALIAKFDRLGDLHGEAIAAAVADFWRRPGGSVDPGSDPWWTVQFRISQRGSQ